MSNCDTHLFIQKICIQCPLRPKPCSRHRGLNNIRNTERALSWPSAGQAHSKKKCQYLFAMLEEDTCHVEDTWYVYEEDMLEENKVGRRGWGMLRVGEHGGSGWRKRMEATAAGGKEIGTTAGGKRSVRNHSEFLFSYLNKIHTAFTLLPPFSAHAVALGTLTLLYNHHQNPSPKVSSSQARTRPHWTASPHPASPQPLETTSYFLFLWVWLPVSGC